MRSFYISISTIESSGYTVNDFNEFVQKVIKPNKKEVIKGKKYGARDFPIVIGGKNE